MAKTKKQKTTTVSDQPNVLTAAAVRRSSDADLGPLRLVLDDDQVVEFPNLGTMEVGVAEDIAIRMQRGRTYTALRKWLTAEHLQLVKDQKLKLIQMMRLAQYVSAHFEEPLAELGLAMPDAGVVAPEDGTVTLADISPKEKLDPLLMYLSGNRKIQFPHLAGMLVEDAENVALALQRERFFRAMSHWLSKSDVAALKAEKFTLLEIGRLGKLVGAHFSEAFSTLGVDMPDPDEDTVYTDV